MNIVHSRASLFNIDVNVHPEPIQEAEEYIPIAQLSGPVASHIISNDWRTYRNAPASEAPMSPAYPSRVQSKVSGYTAPVTSRSGKKGSIPNNLKHLEIQISKPGPSSAIHQGPSLSVQASLSPLIGSREDRSPSYRSSHRERAQQSAEPSLQRLPTPPSRNPSYSYDFHLPTPQTATFFGSQQLTPPTYCDPILTFPGSRHSSISGATPFGWNSEEDRTGEAFRVPSFADAGRVFSGASGIGPLSSKEGYSAGTPHQYRNFSLDSVGGFISHSASSTTVTSAERENRDR